MNVTKIARAAKNQHIPNSMYIAKYENSCQTSGTVEEISIFGDFFNTGNTVEILSLCLSSAYRAQFFRYSHETWNVKPLQEWEEDFWGEF